MIKKLQKTKLATLSAALLISSAAISDGIDHDDLLSCYASIFVQCDVGDQECLDWGYDECDDAYDNSIVAINGLSVATKKGTYKPKGRMKAKAMQIRKSIMLRK